MARTYAGYLELDELLKLQRPLSEGPEHDELLFIVVHQVYELWFKAILHELDHLQALLDGDALPPALHTLKRVLTILKVLVSQLDVLETMTPLDFLSFRDRLESGSGFQSHQFRALEFLLGIKSGRAVERFEPGTAARADLDSRYRRPTLWDTFLHYLARAGHSMPQDILHRDVTGPVEASRAVQEALIGIYRSSPLLVQLCERLVDLDEGIQEWRYRHLKMVQRTIGTKPGTGGSAGAEYLQGTLLRPVFPDLWAIRTDF
jgi:tryptophan 2,3-dioxygenase